MIDWNLVRASRRALSSRELPWLGRCFRLLSLVALVSMVTVDLLLLVRPYDAFFREVHGVITCGVLHVCSIGAVFAASQRATSLSRIVRLYGILGMPAPHPVRWVASLTLASSVPSATGLAVLALGVAGAWMAGNITLVSIPVFAGLLGLAILSAAGMFTSIGLRGLTILRFILVWLPACAGVMVCLEGGMFDSPWSLWKGLTGQSSEDMIRSLTPFFGYWNHQREFLTFSPASWLMLGTPTYSEEGLYTTLFLAGWLSWVGLAAILLPGAASKPGFSSRVKAAVQQAQPRMMKAFLPVGALPRRILFHAIVPWSVAFQFWALSWFAWNAAWLVPTAFLLSYLGTRYILSLFGEHLAHGNAWETVATLPLDSRNGMRWTRPFIPLVAIHLVLTAASAFCLQYFSRSMDLGVYAVIAIGAAVGFALGMQRFIPEMERYQHFIPYQSHNRRNAAVWMPALSLVAGAVLVTLQLTFQIDPRPWDVSSRCMPGATLGETFSWPVFPRYTLSPHGDVGAVIRSRFVLLDGGSAQELWSIPVAEGSEVYRHQDGFLLVNHPHTAAHLIDFYSGRELWTASMMESPHSGLLVHRPGKPWEPVRYGLWSARRCRCTDDSWVTMPDGRQYRLPFEACEVVAFNHNTLIVENGFGVVQWYRLSDEDPVRR